MYEEVLLQDPLSLTNSCLVPFKNRGTTTLDETLWLSAKPSTSSGHLWKLLYWCKHDETTQGKVCPPLKGTGGRDDLQAPATAPARVSGCRVVTESCAPCPAPGRGADEQDQPQLGHHPCDGKELCWLGWEGLQEAGRYLRHDQGLLSSLRYALGKGCPCCPSCQVGLYSWGEMSSLRCREWLQLWGARGWGCWGEESLLSPT